MQVVTCFSKAITHHAVLEKNLSELNLSRGVLSSWLEGHTSLVWVGGAKRRWEIVETNCQHFILLMTVLVPLNSGETRS